MSRKTITLVAKGPSAEHAPDWTRNEFDVATINDAGFLIPHRSIKYTFFTDQITKDKIKDLHYRTAHYVCPEYSIKDGIPEWMKSRLTTYPGRVCGGTHEELLQKMSIGRIAHHSTTTGAMHWLAKHGGYEHMRIIGVDGGTQYAKEMRPIDEQWFRNIQGELGNEFLTDWKQIARRLAQLLHNLYGTTFEWFNGEPGVEA